MPHTHVGYQTTAGYRRTGARSRKAGSCGHDGGARHALVRGDRPGEYAALCGRRVVLDESSFDPNVWPASDGAGVTCRACLAAGA